MLAQKSTQKGEYWPLERLNAASAVRTGWPQQATTLAACRRTALHLVEAGSAGTLCTNTIAAQPSAQVVRLGVVCFSPLCSVHCALIGCTPWTAAVRALSVLLPLARCQVPEDSFGVFFFGILIRAAPTVSSFALAAEPVACVRRAVCSSTAAAVGMASRCQLFTMLVAWLLCGALQAPRVAAILRDTDQDTCVFVGTAEDVIAGLASFPAGVTRPCFMLSEGTGCAPPCAPPTLHLTPGRSSARVCADSARGLRTRVYCLTLSNVRSYMALFGCPALL